MVHRIDLSADALRVARARRGDRPVFPVLVPGRTALVVIDLQNAFMLPGMPLEIPAARAIVPGVNRLASTLRRRGGAVIWVRISFAGQRETWSVWFDHLLANGAAEPMIEALSPGDPAFELYDELDVRAQDTIIDKTRFSAFTPGASCLDSHLRQRGIDTLLIAGTLTNTCCECTARDAMMLNYRVVFLADGTATRTDEEHNATLANMARVFADVATIDAVTARLKP